MLSLLLTAGQGLVWLAGTVATYAVLGAGIGLGYWVMGKITSGMDGKFAERWSRMKAKVPRVHRGHQGAVVHES